MCTYGMSPAMLLKIVSLFVAGGLAATPLVLAPPAQAKSLACAKVDATKKRPMVYAIGSSTMGSVLGKVLKKEFKSKFKAKIYVWGKASSGLARPDFHDWPAQLRNIRRKHKPDYYIVSLGTNDGQALSYKSKGRTRWAKLWTDNHKKIYGDRVTKMLDGMGGSDKQTPIIWIGPTGHPNPKFNRRMRYLRDIQKARIAAYGGNVKFIDGLAATMNPKTGKPRAKVTIPGTKKVRKTLQSDNMHLNWQGARWLLAEPILKRLRNCLPKR